MNFYQAFTMIDIAKIKKKQKTSIFGKYIYHLPEIDSTNSYAHRLAQGGAPEGTIVLADYQTAGKGRQGHVWESTKNSNILMSLILRPSLRIDRVLRITLATADILITSLEKVLQKTAYSQPSFTVKWPNDVLANGKKIGGVLTESNLREKQIVFVVVGVGLNINQDLSQLSSETREQATSLFHEFKESLERESIIAEIISNFERKYFNMERDGYARVVDDWKSRCSCHGQAIEVETHAGFEKGQYVDINDNGALIYRSESGVEKELVAGSIKYI